MVEIIKFNDIGRIEMRVIIAMVISLVLTACVTENQKSLSKDTRGLGQVSKNSKSEQRVALVIGNKDYSSLNPLKNPINDARALRDILSKKRFNVIYLENASQMEMEDAIDKFGYKIKNGKGVGLFYYAGHGMEVDGVNYLIPTDARVPSKKYVKSKSVSTDIIVTAMEEAKNRINILILDSCRSNPFGRDGSGGLAPINSATGIYVAYATAPHKIAQDGEGDNGLFTSYLVKYINQAGLKIEDVFKKVRQGVQRDSNGNQIPWSSSAITGDFYFSLPKQNNIVTPVVNNTSDKNSKIWALEKACNLGDGVSCNSIGYSYEYGERGLQKDLFKAVKFYKKACSLNNAWGCNNLAHEYDDGRGGLTKNPSKAMKLFQKACNSNNGSACTSIGYRYKNGVNIEQNLFKAFKFHKKSCDLNCGTGCYNLGLLYQYGDGVSKDLNKAKEIYKKACDLNYAKGCRRLGNL